MTTCTTVLRVTAPVAAAGLYGSVAAASGALAGFVGAAILNSAGYDGYHPLEAAQMGAIGGATLGGSAGVIAGSLASCGFFNRGSKSKDSSANNTAVSYVAGSVLAGLTGYGIMNYASGETVMDLGRTAASFAVGSAVTMCPATVALMCIFVPLAAMTIYALDIHAEQQSSSRSELMTSFV